MRLYFMAILLWAGLCVGPATEAQAESSLAKFRSYPLASRGYNLIEQRRYEEALKLFERAVKIMPSNIDYRLQLANLLVSEERLHQAYKVVVEGLKLTPNHRGLIMLEDTLRQELAALEINLPPLPEDPSAKARLITSQLFTKQQQQLVERTLDKQVASSDDTSYCDTLLTESPHDLTDGAALNGGYCALDKKQNAKAIQLFENASFSPDKAIAVQALNQLGFMYANKNQHDIASEHWRKSIALEPNPVIEVRIARSLRLSGDVGAAEAMLKDLIQRENLPDEARAEALRELALLFDRQENPQAAFATGEDIVGLNPTASDYYYQALRAQRLGEDTQAIAYLEQANALKPQTYIYLYSLAYAYRAEGQNNQAAQAFQQALQLEDSQTVRLDYAYTLKEMGERKKAADQFLMLQSTMEKAEQMDPLRREVRDLRREWTTFSSISYRDGVFSGIDSTGAQTYEDSFQYGVETVYSPEKWQQQGRRLELYGQIFASSDTGTFNWDQDSTQAALGVRVAPLRNTEWYLYAARLIGLGDNALDDTQIRTTFSNTDGFEYEALEEAWAYQFFNVDVSYLLQEEQLFATSEGRLGRSYRRGQDWVLTPHLVLAGSVLDAEARNSQNLDVGLGVSAKLWMGQTQTQYPDKSLEFIVQWRTPISSDDNKTGPFVRLVAQF